MWVFFCSYSKVTNNAPGTVVPNLPIFSSDQGIYSSADHQENSNLETIREAQGGHPRRSPGMPAPLPDVFFTENYDSPKAEARRQLAALEDEIAAMEQSLQSLIASSDNFYNDPKYMQITRSKDIKLRKKIELLARIQALSGSSEAVVKKPRSPRLGMEPSIDHQDVFYPPPLSRQTGPGGPPVRSQMPLNPSLSLPSFHHPPQLHTAVVGPSLSHSGGASAVRNPRLSGNLLMQQPYSSGSLPHRRQIPVTAIPQAYSILPLPVSTQAKQTPETPTSVGNTWSSKINRTPDKVDSIVGQEQGSSLHSTRQQLTHQWECSHCTYLNKPGANICLMCHRTSDGPRLVREEVGTEETSSSPSLGLLTRHVHEEMEQVRLPNFVITNQDNTELFLNLCSFSFVLSNM